jgi:Domain of unknown function (DUF4190)
METPTPIPPALIRNNIYALLAPVSGAIALLGNCLTFGSIVVPGLPFLCATISGIFSLIALALGIVALLQLRKSDQKGRGLAITGVVLGVLGVITACVLPFIGTALWTLFGLNVGTALGVPLK